jgi:hypothetical protein
MNLEDLARLKNNLTSFDNLEKITKHSTGANLGLSISNVICKTLGRNKFGGLLIDSEEDKGSSFSFYIYNS